jgi:hypothetical protein
VVTRRALVAAVVVALLLVALGATALGAEPSPSPTTAAVLEGGDLRSDGGGPGLVGNPLLILGAVLLLGLATAAVTVLVARLLYRR